MEDVIYFYVYRITNIKSNEHYYGSRKSKIDPKEDLGKVYFSSSSNKEFLLEQKEKPENFKYKVIRIFNCKSKSIEFEIKLHEKFDVENNPMFINKKNQRKNGFHSNGFKCGILLNDPNKEILFVSVKDPRWLSGELIHFQKGKVLSNHTKKLLSENNKGKMAAKWADGRNNETLHIDVNDPRRISGELVGVHKGVKRKPFTDETRRKMRISNKRTISQETRKKLSEHNMDVVCCYDFDGNFLKVSKSDPRLINGELITAAVYKRPKIGIYDNEDNLVFECRISFSKFCELNNLPYSALNTSLKNNSKPIYTELNSRGISQVKYRGYYAFLGWYAKYIKK